MSRIACRTNRRSRRDRSLRADEDGAAIIEFALVLPILLLLVAGCFEIARALLVHHAMTEGVRGGARYLARVPEPVCTPACSIGAARAVAMTRAVILDNSGLGPASVRAAPSPAPPPGTVVMQAEVALASDLLVLAGLDRVLILRASHGEVRIAD